MNRGARARTLCAWTMLLGAVQAAPVAHATAAHALAAHSWTSVTTAHVELLTDAGREVGERVAERLEDLRTVLALVAPALVAEVAPVQAFVFRDAASVESYAPTWHGQRDQVAGFFQTAPDRRRLFFQYEPLRLPSVAQHEYTHALLDAAMPEAPLWLNEGLAEYFSTFTASADRAQAGAPIQAHLEWLAQHDLMPLSELFSITQGSAAYHEGDRRGTFYAQSWAFTHMILSGTDDDLSRLERVLVLTREGERFLSAFTRVFGEERSLHARLLDYLEHPRLTVRDWVLRNPLGARRPIVRERVSPAAVLGSLGTALLARATPQREDAEEQLREALSLDPRDPDACAGMGWLQLQRGRRDEARDWFKRALVRDPVSVPAVRLMASQLLLETSQRSSATERQSASELVRQAVERARAIAPDDPELEAMLARCYVVWPGADPSPGWPHVVRATEALPARSDLLLDRLALAALLGREDEAWQLFNTHFRNAARPELAHAARTALLVGEVRAANLMLARGDVPGAQARLRSARERLGDDAEVVRDADRYLAQLSRAQASVQQAADENTARGEYNAAAREANAQHYADAAAGFRRAAAASDGVLFRKQALRMALRMDQRARGERALALAKAGDLAAAQAMFEAMDRVSMSDEDRRWLDRNLTQLKRLRAH